MPSPASDAINRLVVKAVAVALTFPVAAEIYWFVNHLPKDLNEESFPNGGGGDILMVNVSWFLV